MHISISREPLQKNLASKEHISISCHIRLHMHTHIYVYIHAYVQTAEAALAEASRSHKLLTDRLEEESREHKDRASRLEEELQLERDEIWELKSRSSTCPHAYVRIRIHLYVFVRVMCVMCICGHILVYTTREMRYGSSRADLVYSDVAIKMHVRMCVCVCLISRPYFFVADKKRQKCSRYHAYCNHEYYMVLIFYSSREQEQRFRLSWRTPNIFTVILPANLFT